VDNNADVKGLISGTTSIHQSGFNL